ncbi:MAG TPA: hypothetical protein VHO47_01390 [Candidatus Babeliales bacterium]|nr:hypothetical protein [Candidatus Babeliales bacterium]
MKLNNLFKVMVLAICFALPVRAGIITGTVSIGLGIGLGLKALEQRDMGPLAQLKNSASSWLKLDSQFNRMVKEGEKELNKKFGDKTTIMVYGTGSVVCILYGIKKILL